MYISRNTKQKTACMSYLVISLKVRKVVFFLKNQVPMEYPCFLFSKHVFKTVCQTSFRSRKLIRVFRTKKKKKRVEQTGLEHLLLNSCQSFATKEIQVMKTKGIQFLVFQLAMQLKESHISINRNISVSFYCQYAIFLQTFQRRKKIVARIKKRKG